MKFLFVVVMCLIVAAQSGEAHICMVSPVQRGGYDISEPGAAACFAPVAPCGSNRFWPRDPSKPVIALRGGTLHSVLATQALNHYNVGEPGYLDVSWARGHNQTSQAAFQLLAMANDHYENFQATLTNYTFSVLVPNVAQDWATLQVRYTSRKPNEPQQFHNCADIKIVETDLHAVRSTIGDHSRLYALNTINQQLNYFDAVTGSVAGVPVQPFDRQFLQGTAARTGGAQSQIYYLASSRVTPDVTYLVKAGSDHAVPLAPPVASSMSPSAANATFAQFSSLVGNGGQLFAIAMYSTTTPNNFRFGVLSVDDVTTGATSLVALTPATDRFVNFQYAAFDSGARTMHVLLGDEDAPQSLDASLYTVAVDAPAATSFSVQLDVSAFTFESIYPLDGSLYAVSPGLVPANYDISAAATSHHVVEIDYKTGSVRAVAPIGLNDELFPAAQLTGAYTGGIAAPSASLSPNAPALLPYLFTRSLDQARLLAWIDVSDGSIYHSAYLAWPLSFDWNSLVLS